VVSKEPQRKLVVSQSTILLDQKGAYVMVVGGDNTVESRRVELGEQRGPDIVVSSGLAAGDRVILYGLQKVRPGIKVEVHEPKSAASGK
jgi:membrane fusion protein (multidrug efflux system)